jgi:predicted enzyme related to lactoylglutathione lyase
LSAACEFYQQQFDLKLVGWTDDGTVRLSDGTVTLLLTKSQVRPKSGVQYFGIQVSDLAGVKKRLQDGGVDIREGSEEIRLTDPEGNQVAISQSGWTN